MDHEPRERPFDPPEDAVQRTPRQPSDLDALPSWTLPVGFVVLLVILGSLMYYAISGPVRARQASPPPSAPSAQPYVKQADDFVYQGRMEEAMALYSLAVALEPQNGRALASWGWTLTVRGRAAEAITRLTAATAVEPENAEYHALLALAYDWNGDYDKAGASLKTALRLGKDLLRVQVAAAEVYPDLGQVSDGVTAGQRAVALDAKSPEAHHAYGYALQAASDYERAIQEFQQAIALNPKLAYHRLGLGAAYRASGKTVEAAREFQRVIDAEPLNPQGWEGLGVTFYRQKDYGAAIPLFERAAELDPSRFSPVNYLGWSHYLAGRYDLAVPLFERALAIDANKADTHAGLGWALANRAAYDRARSAFEKALAINPNLQSAKDGLAAIEGKR
jgi:tetratricopeptide (TPR) repeat protein